MLALVCVSRLTAYIDLGKLVIHTMKTKWNRNAFEVSWSKM